MVRLQLQDPPPGSTARRKNVNTYTGQVSYSHTIGAWTDYGSYLPAFALLRFHEDAALPYRCGTHEPYHESVMQAAQWIAPLAPVWSGEAIMRTGSRRLIERWFDRVRIAGLDAHAFERWYSAVLNSFEQAVKGLQIANRPDHPSEFHHLQAQGELLSRLTFRLSLTERDDLLSRLLALYRAPESRAHRRLHQPLALLLERTLRWLTEDQLCAALADLVALPIPGAEGFEVASLEEWKEPFEYLRPLRLRNCAPSPQLRSAVGRLLDIARTGPPYARSRAVWRLAVLFEGQLLTVEQAAAFGEAIWNEVDPDSGLPTHVNLLYAALLALPEPEPGIAQGRVREYLNTADFPRFMRDSRSSGDQRVAVIPRDPSRYAKEWMRSTSPFKVL